MLAATGMTLLDYFAGQAIGGMMARACVPPAYGVASAAYDLAAAMIAEKRRREGQQ